MCIGTRNSLLHYSAYRCEEGWKAWKDHCYYLSYMGVLKNWQDARDDCLSMGSDLASITSMGENDFIEGYTVQESERFSY